MYVSKSTCTNILSYSINGPIFRKKIRGTKNAKKIETVRCQGICSRNRKPINTDVEEKPRWRHR